MPPRSKIGGHIVFVLSVILSFCPPLWNFNLANNFWTVSARALIFHMNIPCDKTFPWVPLFFTLWPWPWPYLELAIIRGICVSQTHLVNFECSFYLRDSSRFIIFSQFIVPCIFICKSKIFHPLLSFRYNFRHVKQNTFIFTLNYMMYYTPYKLLTSFY